MTEAAIPNRSPIAATNLSRDPQAPSSRGVDAAQPFDGFTPDRRIADQTGWPIFWTIIGYGSLAIAALCFAALVLV